MQSVEQARSSLQERELVRHLRHQHEHAKILDVYVKRKSALYILLEEFEGIQLRFELLG